MEVPRRKRVIRFDQKLWSKFFIDENNESKVTKDTKNKNLSLKRMKFSLWRKQMKYVRKRERRKIVSKQEICLKEQIEFKFDRFEMFDTNAGDQSIVLRH